MRIPLILFAIALGVIVVISVIFLLPQPTPPVELDTETHSLTVNGFYGEGTFGGELLRNDAIRSNVTQDGYSQSVVFQGRVCSDGSNGGRVFLNGAKSSEPDAFIELRIDDTLVLTSNFEVGDSSALRGCFDLPQRDSILSGDNRGKVVRANLYVYVTGLLSGTGRYELLAWDQAPVV